jgi:hypothetical protein
MIFHPVIDAQSRSALSRLDRFPPRLPKLSQITPFERLVHALAEIASVKRNPAAQHVSAFLHSAHTGDGPLTVYDRDQKRCSRTDQRGKFCVVEVPHATPNWPAF